MGLLGVTVVAKVDSIFQGSWISMTPQMWSESNVLCDLMIRIIVWECRYLKSLLVFSHDKAGNVGNLSRIDPSILGVKDAGSYTKNALYLHGVSSAPLLCFSLVLVAKDTHESGRIIRSDPKEWVVKDIAGVLLAMELERFIAVLGLAFDLPYVPDDSSRREGSLLYFSMIENAFYFSTTMVSKNGEHG